MEHNLHCVVPKRMRNTRSEFTWTKITSRDVLIAKRAVTEPKVDRIKMALNDVPMVVAILCDIGFSVTNQSRDTLLSELSLYLIALKKCWKKCKQKKLWKDDDYCGDYQCWKRLHCRNVCVVESALLSYNGFADDSCAYFQTFVVTSKKIIKGLNYIVFFLYGSKNKYIFTVLVSIKYVCLTKIDLFWLCITRTTNSEKNSRPILRH